MASNHIVIPTTTPLGSQLSGVVNSMGSANSALNRIAAIVATYNADYVSMAADFGFTGANAATNMQTVVTLMGSALANGVNQADFVNAMNRLG